MKNDIEILRCLLQLNIPWQNELTESNDLKKKEIIKNGLLVIDKIIKDSDLKHEEIDILNDALINKHEKMEKVAVRITLCGGSVPGQRSAGFRRRSGAGERAGAGNA